MKVPIAIVGCGLMGGVHAACFAREKNCEIVGYYNPTRSKAEALAARYGGVVYDCLPDLLRRSPAEAICIASPQQAHAGQVIAAAEAGKHILCEKPLALAPAEFAAMETAVAQSGRIFMTAHQMRFHPVINWVLGNRSRLGAVYHLDLEWPLLLKGHQGRCWEDYRSGGFFMELGCHAADLTRHLMGDVRHLTAFTQRLNPQRVTEDCTHCLLQFTSGAIGSLLVSANHRGKRQGMLTGRLLGEKGRLDFTVYPYGRAWNSASIFFDDGQDIFVPSGRREKMDTKLPRSLSRDYPGFFDVYQRQASAFLHSVRTGVEPPITFADGRAAVEIVLSAYASQAEATDHPNRGALPYRAEAGCHPAVA